MSSEVEKILEGVRNRSVETLNPNEKELLAHLLNVPDLNPDSDYMTEEDVEVLKSLQNGNVEKFKQYGDVPSALSILTTPKIELEAELRKENVRQNFSKILKKNTGETRSFNELKSRSAEHYFMFKYVFGIKNDSQYKELLKTLNFNNNTSGGAKRKPVSKKKSVRKHKGIYQRGPKAGKLKTGYKYSGKKTKTGLKIIVKV